MISKPVQWFPLFDLGLVAASGALWYNWPELGIWPLALALLPWAVRLAKGKPPIQRTRFDLLIVIFLITAGIGVWTAYNRGLALAKFWLIVEAVLLYYALAGQPESNLGPVGAGIGIFGSGVAGYFLLTHDWTVLAAKIEILNQIGLSWMGIRPELHTHNLHPNVASGITAVTFPFLVASLMRAWRERAAIHLIGMIAVMGISLTGLLLGTSRGTILALSASLFIWGLWGVSGILLPESVRKSIFFTILGLLLGFGLVILFTFPGGPIALANRIPGPQQASKRLDMVRASLNLIGDFPITGGGLDTYPALYSEYILVKPLYTLAHGHNLLLDVTQQQGFLGGLTYLAIILAAFWSLTRWKAESRMLEYLQWATLTGILVMVSHGLVDDVLYGSRGAMLVLFPIGMSVALTQARTPQTRANLSALKYPGLVLALAALASLAVFYRPLLASWYANLGALEMARIELAGWPSGKWDNGYKVEALKPAETLFHKALQNDSFERTAHHRLGLIAMLEQDFPTAIDHLEIAHQIGLEHRGVRKNLGYSYAWAGQYDSAREVLATISEAQDELQVYIWWWGTQDREDLSQKASHMVTLLEGAE